MVILEGKHKTPFTHCNGLDDGQDLVEDLLLGEGVENSGHDQVLVVVRPGYVQTCAKDRLSHQTNAIWREKRKWASIE